MRKKLSYIIPIVLSFIVLLSVAVLTSCKPEEEVILNVYNWGEYISDGEEGSVNVNYEFEKYFNNQLSDKYGFKVKVNYTTYSSNEELYAKLKNTNTPYDVIIPSDYLVALLIREDMLHKINFDNVPNFSYIDEDYIKGNYYDKTNEYSVPYTMGKVGIIYNTDLIDEKIDSWGALWDEKYADKGILQFNNQRDAFATAHFLLGMDINTTNKSDWDEAQKMLFKQKDIIQKYVMDEVFNKMESGNAAIAPYYAGDYFTMYSSNDKLEFAYPKEGSNVFIDAMCIPKSSQHKELAEIYINFMLDKDIAKANAEYICYASPHKGVYNDEDYIRYMNEEIHPNAIDILYNDFEKEFLKEGFVALDTETQEYVNELWDELKISSDTPIYIYILSSIIVVATISSFVFYGIRKKIREKTY